MSTVVTVPLPQNPEVADLVADMQPGDRVYGCFSIRSKDDQTLELRIEEMAATKDELPDKGDYDEDDDDSDEDVEGGQKPNDIEDGDGSDDEVRSEAQANAGY